MLLTACGSSSSGGATATHDVRIPLGAGGVGFLPLLVMKERGLIEKHTAERYGVGEGSTSTATPSR